VLTSRLARALAIALPLALVSSAGCDIAMANLQGSAQEEWRKTYELEPGGRVEIRNVNGRIVVERSAGRQVEVVAEKRARGSSDDAARQVLEQIQIVESATPSALTVETKAPRGRGVSAEVRYSVKVPADSDLRFQTVNGGIELTQLSGQIDAETTNGGITAREIAGSFKGTTTNGGLEVDLTSLAKEGVTLECVNGGISLRLPGDARATVSASISNGGIDTHGLPIETSTSNRRRLEGTLNGGGAPIRLSGTNGGISLRAR
jgi:hypothetical protein